ncbi:2-phospho-L-lactate guanylyltransferase [Nocardioides terrigena]|uniref:2-phospho-L-lactate guanylyltransferase n=1 Tax=Nocardioides terrigena TaxID=424797 RepID=UPI000D301EBE|nr:2-phospho-L-lactate guanylyltransferase [Nocardioides terrigena]
MGSPEGDFRVVVPVKELRHAKTRLEVDEATRHRLALAFAVDTVEVALGARWVGEVVVLTRDRQVAREVGRLGARSMRPGGTRELNSELRWALRRLGVGSRRPTAVLMADLPALRACELDHVLGDARAGGDVVFVEDAWGGGTTLLAGPSGGLVPRFGGRSASRHREVGARGVRLELPGLRCDVDDVRSLSAAVEHGLNPRAKSVVEAMSLEPHTRPTEAPSRGRERMGA